MEGSQRNCPHLRVVPGRPGIILSKNERGNGDVLSLNEGRQGVKMWGVP